jgi:hypothetical protein
MTPARRLPPATVCGHPLHHSAHICAFFDSEQQEYGCLVPYFAEGLARGEQVVTIRDAERCNAHVAKLRASGAIPVDDAIRANRLRVMASEETYLLEGVFEVERMYRMIERALTEAPAAGFSRVRTCGEMSWALRGMPGTDDLMEYESRVNELTQQHDCTLMCTYDINKIGGRALMDVLATHPVVLLGDRIYENPYYQKPMDFLKGLLHRGAAPMRRVAAAEPA